jgi:hypothetical protein
MTVIDAPTAVPVRRRRLNFLAHVFAAAWSAAYLGLGLAWLAGVGGNPADPTVDTALAEDPALSLLGLAGPTAGAAVLTALGALGVVLSAILARTPRRLPPRVPVVLAVVLGLVLSVVLPDYRLIAMVAYTPILLVLAVFGAMPEQAPVWPWPIVNMGLLSLAGLAFLTTAAAYRRRTAPAGGRSVPVDAAAAARWGRWAVGIAVAVPVGYAITRLAWALGIPLGVSQAMLDELGDGVYAGAALATLAVGGAVLTLGLVQRWGEVFPRWMPLVRGRSVPVGLATIPARIVAVIVTSAGLMFVRLGAGGYFGDLFDSGNNLAAWLPEMFWPLWGVALAAASYAYEIRRRATDRLGCETGSVAKPA